jgi:hypothetical protein
LAVNGADLGLARLAPLAGEEGWLARLPGAVIFLPRGGDDSEQVLSSCLASGGGTDLLAGVGTRLADLTSAPLPPLVIVGARGDDLVVLVHGPVELTIEREGGPERLYGGDQVGSWLNRALPPVHALHVGQGIGPAGLVDLGQGVIRAGGFLLAARRPGVEGSMPQARSRPPEADDVALDRAPAGSRAGAEDDATVMGPAAAQSATMVAGRGTVSGAGREMGTLTWDNGEVHHLLGAVLVGRDVATDVAVMAGDVAPLVPSGENDSMSRVHAELRPSGRDVVVLDRGSTNGTFVWDEPSKAWQRLPPGEPHLLRRSTVLAFGERTATFDPRRDRAA